MAFYDNAYFMHARERAHASANQQTIMEMNKPPWWTVEIPNRTV